MHTRLMLSGVAVTAALTLALGSALGTGPAAAAQKPVVDVDSDTALQAAVLKNLADDDGGLSSEVGRFGVEGDTLVLGVSKKTEDVKDFASDYSNVEVEVDSRFVEAEPQNRKDLVGGAGYLIGVGGSQAVCSLGFPGWDQAGRQIVITAGHCAEDQRTGAQTSLPNLELPSSAQAVGGRGFASAGVGSPGTWGYHQFGSGISAYGQIIDPNKAIDFGVINAAPGFTTKAELTNWTTARSEDLSLATAKVSRIGGPQYGAYIRKSGRTTGLTQGIVTPNQQYQFANVGGRAVHGFEVTSVYSAFSRQGDSGGGVYQGNTAVGVISGGPASGQWTWVADLNYSLAKSGVSFRLTPPQ